MLDILVGLGAALFVGLIFRVVIGSRLNLYLVNRDSAEDEQALIPITSEFKKSSIFKSLIGGQWQEDLDLTLLDDTDQSYTFKIYFNFFRRYYLISDPNNPEVQIDYRPIKKGKKYNLRTGMHLSIGERVYSIYVTPLYKTSEIYRELAK